MHDCLYLFCVCVQFCVDLYERRVFDYNYIYEYSDTHYLLRYLYLYDGLYTLWSMIDCKYCA